MGLGRRAMASKPYSAAVEKVSTDTFFYQCVFLLLLLHRTPEELMAFKDGDMLVSIDKVQVVSCNEDIYIKAFSKNSAA